MARGRRACRVGRRLTAPLVRAAGRADAALVPRTTVKPALLVLLLVLVGATHRTGIIRHGVTTEPTVARADAASEKRTWTFDPGVSELNRRAFLGVLTHVRPEAARLYARVAGLVTVVDGDTGSPNALGVTIPTAGGYTVRFRFGQVFGQLGQRGFDRVVEHELAHVVDFALLTDPLRTELDAGIPPGVPCNGTNGPIGSCAPRRERFAESFAKWASGDLGVNLYAGYAVPPPPDLNAWGAPLAALAGGR
jgi:hypothetical protein